MFLTRDPDLVLGWGSHGVRVRNPATGVEIAGPRIAEILARFENPRSLESALREFPVGDRKAVRALIEALRAEGLLVRARRSAKVLSRERAWRGELAAAQYHGACRDLPYFQKAAEIREHIRTVVQSVPRPPAFKEYGEAPVFELPKSEPAGDAAALGRILGARQTVRRFRRTPVSLAQLSLLLRGVFALTGMLVTDFGPLGTRTSPSAGALHPIEAYLLTWNVEGLSSGLYHYDVLGDGLRRLRRGSFRRAAVDFASGQMWIAQAAFLCVLTASFPRVLWKYPTERSYRNLFLDAGHLAQTFCLLATSLGLGPFTTAALQDSKIEKFLGIDGIDEFPVYLCGAGVPAKKTARRAGGSGPLS